MKLSAHRLFKVSKRNSGFTLVELLIVIAILGILATAVLSALNPIEQINRGRDTGTQSDAEQLLGAVARFNAANGYLPWQIGASDVAHLATNQPVKVGAPGAAATVAWSVQGAVRSGTANPSSPAVAGDSVLQLLGSGTNGTLELQNTYVTKVDGVQSNTLYVFNRGQAGDSTYVCFKPQSKSFVNTANQRWGTGCATMPADLPSGTNWNFNGAVTVCTAATPANSLYCLP